MLLVEWLPQARESLFEIVSYLIERNPYAAEDLHGSIEEKAEALPHT